MALLNKLFPSSATSSSSLTSAWKTPSSSPSASPAIPGAGNSTTTPAPTAKASANANSKRLNNNQSVISTNYLSQFPFDVRQIRVLLYKEEAERRLLFDSNALKKVPLKETNGNDTAKATRFDEKSSMAHHNSSKIAQLINKQQQLRSGKGHSNNFIEVCEKYGYRHNRPDSADITSIGEMVFGASAVSFRGTSLKVHWLQNPSRILCSQVFLTPIGSSVAIGGSHSPNSTISANSLATPRTSISSEHGSIDDLSINSFSMPFSVNVGRHLSLTPSVDHFSMSTASSPLDVPDQQSLSTNADSTQSERGPRYSSTYSNATDSGYSGMSRSQVSSDQWSSASYQYSTRSSLGSLMSEQLDPLRKFSIDFTSVSSSYGGNIASDGNLQRRITRNLLTSFENEYAKNDWIGFINDNVAMSTTTTTTINGGGSEGGNMGVPNYRRASYSANESRSNPEIGRRRGDAATIRTMSKRAKLGLAVCITMSESFEEEMELFCSEHIALLESMLSRLRARTERAYINHKDFLQIMYHAWQDTQQWFNDLFTAPRIKCPIWLSITTSGSKYSKSVAERFMKELGWLLSFADTKKTNFFISTMLTAILTHHLGWVSTVAAFNSSSSRSETSVAAIEQRAKLLQVSQKHPYNALWAQMGDLYGAIGLPPKLARTVVYGTEKLPVERLLNILTYFIRCGEVRRSAKREDFNKELINTIVSQKSIETVKKPSSKKYSSGIKKSKIAGEGGCDSDVGVGLTRTQTCKQNLNTISDNNAELSSGSSEELESNEVELAGTLKKNEIPNVFAFRDSRFVQQELRIGNYLMDTGIEKKSLLWQRKMSHSQESGGGKDGRIRLTVTTPDNVEMCVEDENPSSVEDCAVEAIEIDISESDTLVSSETKAAAVLPHSIRKNFFWNMVPESVREGLSLNDLHQNGGKRLDGRSSSHSNERGTDGDDCADEENEPLQKRVSHLSLSDLITQNSMGKSDRMTWGIEPIKENVSLEEQIHFDFCQKLIEREHGICLNNTDNENSGDNGDKDGSGVVFVLGENEPLVNLKKSTEDLMVELSLDSNKQQTFCPLHQGTRTAGSSKKHSGVKFNFEQYPQIATNYMRSKNLVMSNYELLMDKATKLEADEASHSQKSLFPTSTTSSTTMPVAATTECLACNCMFNAYQTPSNATELEFDTDEVRCSSTSLVMSDGGSALHAVSSATSIDTLKASASNRANDITTSMTQQQQEQHQDDLEPTSSPSASIVSVKKTPTFSGNAKKVSSHRGSISSVAAKCAAVSEAVHLLKLPVPAIKELPQDDEPLGDMKLRAGFIPSLFLNVSDHYISDMVLQGTCASPAKWETNLREDLALAAHSASFISLPAENIAIVADMEKWDVRLISSQSQSFLYAGGQSTPVGMSQLVSSMLETVQAMSSAGISAYEIYTSSLLYHSLLLAMSQ